MVKSKTKKVIFYVGAAALIVYLLGKLKKPSFMETGNSLPDNSNEGGTGVYDAEKSNNLRLLNDTMKAQGITNRYARTAIMAVVGKESNFIPKYENCYNNTSNERIRSIFPTRLGGLSDTYLNQLKADCEDFFDAVYGDRNGTPKNEGYKYRGSGYNQLTFKNNYRKIGNLINVDLVNNPDLNNRPDIAAQSVSAYMIDAANSSTGKGKLAAGGFNTYNDINNLDFAVRFFANANAGLGYSFNGDRVNDAVAKSTPYLSKVYFYSI